MSASRTSSVFASRRKPLAACVATLFGLSASAAVHAGTAVVTNCATSAATVGSLPWAATQAINTGDVIDMTGITDFSACGHDIDGFAQSIVLPSVVTVSTGVTIKGPNTSSSKALAVSSGALDRVFYSSGSLTIKNLGIKYAQATATTGNTVYGGCVFARHGITLDGVVLDHCSAYTKAASTNAKGGSVATSQGPIVLTNSTITHSYATSHNSGAAFGGAVYAQGDVTLTNSRVSYNNATAKSGYARGGGIAVRGGSTYTVTLTGSSGVEHSYADGYGGFNASGGGIYSSGDVTLSDSLLFATGALQHTATGGRAAGGCIFAKQDVSLSDHSIMQFCYATTASSDKALGGGIYGGAGVTLANSSVYDTGASSASGDAYGGGIFSVGQTAGHYSVLFDNVATLSSSFSQGGAIFSKGGVSFKYGRIESGSAQQDGGIAVETGDLYLRGVTLAHNYAKVHASALGMSTGGTGSAATIINSTISGNTVGSASGKYAVFIDAYTTKFYNSTIAYNTGGTAAGTVLTGVTGSKAGLYSTLMSSNSYSNGTQNDFSKSTNVTFTASSSHNLIRHPGSIVPTGTLTGAGACPFLHKLADNGGPTMTHRLGGSVTGAQKNPAIDTGSNPKPLGSDQRGGSLSATTPARVSGSKADIGAYEVQQDDIIFDGEFDSCLN
jgi:predicted outer membrane repeat protein